MLARPRFARLFQALWPVAASAVTLAAFFAVGRVFLESYTLDLGAWGLPAIRHTYFMFLWTLPGSAAGVLLAIGVYRLQALVSGERVAPAAARDRLWIAAAAGAAFLVPCAIRAFALHGAPLTDDESAYRFMAQVLASGRLTAESPPMKAFFDRVFMINDGRFYAQYFIGWPALMVPGVPFGLTGYMNAAYSALTVPAVFLTVRRMAGAPAARVATLLYLASPMLAIGAATELSHTTCLLAAAWATYCLLRCWDDPSDWRWHAGVAACFGAGFLIRPLATLGIGAPVLIGWFVHAMRQPPAARRRAMAWFAAPALASAFVFFAVNAAQNGSPLTTAYQRAQQYMREVNFKNVGWSEEKPPVPLTRYVFGGGGWRESLAHTTVALVRLAYDLFGSPLLLGLVAFGWAVKGARIAWCSALGFLAAHFALADPGVDTFGPVHYYELSWPLIVLAGAGFARLTALARAWRVPRPGAWSTSIAAALMAVSLVGFAPVRLAAVRTIASNVNAPDEAMRARGITRAVVFTAGLFVDQSCIAPTRHFVHFRPNNDPSLGNDILWANHLGWEEDQALMAGFPGRTPYLMTWKDCRVHFQEIR